ncbi:hypothetical protein GC722_12475 [Auraticoccus sp. F435]|uniref:Uncharacterized protein n=1 Tax=Auraticoccus cholistanensis TaxID=2656650 RepID=A0A6A9UYD5_9ACTN|nr:hypothetical protein [Auraticoccus cholistanensis]MVA76832.1 hypothetical protein [Auraticoccus cholistanensis]
MTGAAHVDRPALERWFAERTGFHPLGPRDDVLLAFGDGETSYAVRAGGEGFELLRASHSSLRPVAGATHLDDALRLLALAVLPSRAPQLRPDDLGPGVTLDLGQDGAGAAWSDAAGEHHRVRVGALGQREQLLVRLSRCAQASLPEIERSLATPDGAPLLVPRAAAS